MRKSFNPAFWFVLLFGLYGLTTHEFERQAKVKERDSYAAIKAKFIKIDDHKVNGVWERITHFEYSYEGTTYPIQTKHKVDIKPFEREFEIKIKKSDPGTPIYPERVTNWWGPEDLSFRHYHSASFLFFLVALVAAYTRGPKFSGDFREQFHRESFAFVDAFKKRNPYLFQGKKAAEPTKGWGYIGMFLIFYFVVNSVILLKSEWSRNKMIKRVVPVEATLVSRAKDAHRKENVMTETYTYSIGGKSFQFKEFDFDKDAVPGESSSYYVDPWHPEKLRKTREGTFFGDHVAFFTINFSIMFFFFFFSIPAFVFYKAVKWLMSRLQKTEVSSDGEKADDDRMAS